MPGIVTHSKIFKYTIGNLSKKEKKSYLLKSIETLFNTPEHLSAGLFGAIGPNIFDYIPKRNRQDCYGSDESFSIHNGGSESIIQSMIKKIYSYKDKNNEWTAIQRAYLYGFISHVISDSIFHPFVFYYSGFPEAYTKKEIIHYREQNLLFQYHIDNYLQYHDEKTEQYTFNLDEMLVLEKKFLFCRLNHAVKSLMLDSIKDSHPDIYSKIFLLNKKKPDNSFTAAVSYLDLIPYLIKMTYYLKKNNSKRLADLLKKIRKKNRFFSDFIIQYPQNKKYDKDVLNKHRERWDYPTGKPGIHYDSVYNLIANSCERTVGLWEKIESCIYGRENLNVMNEFKLNAYTGDAKLSYRDMKVKRPIRLSM